jgi:hypothetical protein
MALGLSEPAALTMIIAVTPAPRRESRSTVLPPILEFAVERLLGLFVEGPEVIVAGLKLPVAPALVAVVLAHARAVMMALAHAAIAIVLTSPDQRDEPEP